MMMDNGVKKEEKRGTSLNRLSNQDTGRLAWMHKYACTRSYGECARYYCNIENPTFDHSHFLLRTLAAACQSKTRLL